MINLFRFIIFMMIFPYPLYVLADGKENESVTIPTTICSVMASPNSFLNKKIMVRGFVYLGEDHMNITDIHCYKYGIELVITSSSVMFQKDVHHFYLQMNHQGRKGYATITGVFQTFNSPITPYVLNIKHVKDVMPPH